MNVSGTSGTNPRMTAVPGASEVSKQKQSTVITLDSDDDDEIKVNAISVYIFNIE